jgi:hypothetical protein
MRSFILAAIAATATAMYENEHTIIAAAPIANADATFGALTVMSGWKSNGAGVDQTLDFKLMFTHEKDAS